MNKKVNVQGVKLDIETIGDLFFNQIKTLTQKTYIDSNWGRTVAENRGCLL